MEVLHRAWSTEDRRSAGWKPLLHGGESIWLCNDRARRWRRRMRPTSPRLQRWMAMTSFATDASGRCSGIGHPNCRVLIFMGVSVPDAPKHQRHSMVLIPIDHKGVPVRRMLPVFNCLRRALWSRQKRPSMTMRVPRSNIIAGAGAWIRDCAGTARTGADSSLHAGHRCRRANAQAAMCEEQKLAGGVWQATRQAGWKSGCDCRSADADRTGSAVGAKDCVDDRSRRSQSCDERDFANQSWSRRRSPVRVIDAAIQSMVVPESAMTYPDGALCVCARAADC